MKVPRIDSPCPRVWRTLPTRGKDFCTQCERRVHDLSGMTDEQRRDFFASCSGKVCVAYTVRPARTSTALRLGLGVAAAICAAPAIAQDAAPMSPVDGARAFPYTEPPHVKCDDEGAPGTTTHEDIVIWVGGVDDAQTVRWIDAGDEHPQLPVVTDDAFIEADFIEAPEAPGSR
jgi:hypothetical protein